MRCNVFRRRARLCEAIRPHDGPVFGTDGKRILVDVVASKDVEQVMGVLEGRTVQAGITTAWQASQDPDRASQHHGKEATSSQSHRTR